jgi:hypothetical protein
MEAVGRSPETIGPDPEGWGDDVGVERDPEAVDLAEVAADD